jgi:protein-tyrosine phosphatase
MPETLAWQRSDPRAVIPRAVRALLDGRLVGLPTDTGRDLAACALDADAVRRLAACSPDGPPALAVGGAAEALDWVPDMTRLGRRLTRRCWPGPVALSFADGHDGGLAGRLPAGVRDVLCPDGALGLRSPGHDAVLQVLRLMPCPVVLAGGPGDGGEPLAHADLVLEDGPGYPGHRLTVVRVDRGGWAVQREGTVTASGLAEVTPCVVLFVCTGNTCRSPLAEALCKKLLADRLGCTPAELPGRGYLILSAGLSALPGAAAADEAVAVARELGADLQGHRSRPLGADLAAQADHLLVMTQGHLRALADQFARAGARPRLLAADGGDVADPIGGDEEVYRACARQLLAELERLVPELELS